MNVHLIWSEFPKITRYVSFGGGPNVTLLPSAMPTGDDPDVIVWCDEDLPESVAEECLCRLLHRKGRLMRAVPHNRERNG